jgi:hypothetical protein
MRDDLFQQSLFVLTKNKKKRKNIKTYKLSISDSYKITQNLQTVNIWQLQNHTKPTNCQHLTVTKSHKTYQLSTSDSYKITQNLKTVNIW